MFRRLPVQGRRSRSNRGRGHRGSSYERCRASRSLSNIPRSQCLRQRFGLVGGKTALHLLCTVLYPTCGCCTLLRCVPSRAPLTRVPLPAAVTIRASCCDHKHTCYHHAPPVSYLRLTMSCGQLRPPLHADIQANCLTSSAHLLNLSALPFYVNLSPRSPLRHRKQQPLLSRPKCPPSTTVPG